MDGELNPRLGEETAAISAAADGDLEMLAGVEEVGRRRPKAARKGNSPDFDSSSCLRLEQRIAAVHGDRPLGKAVGPELNSIV